MGNQPALPFPGAEEWCPKCKGNADVYYLHAKMPHVDVVGGKRVVCPVCEGAGKITVTMQHKVKCYGLAERNLRMELLRSEIA